MPKSVECIYRRQWKDDGAYTEVEHVLPQSFGRFQNNFTLIRMVCDECNQFFGNHLELNLARDTVEGQSRVDLFVRRPEEFRSPGRRSRMKIRIAEGPLKGAYAYRHYSEDAGAVELVPVPQVLFRQRSRDEYMYFPLDDLPGQDEFDSLQLDVQHAEAIRAFGVSVDDLSVSQA